MNTHTTYSYGIGPALDMDRRYLPTSPNGHLRWMRRGTTGSYTAVLHLLRRSRISSDPILHLFLFNNDHDTPDCFIILHCHLRLGKRPFPKTVVDAQQIDCLREWGELERDLHRSGVFLPFHICWCFFCLRGILAFIIS